MTIKVVPHEVAMAIEKRNLELQHELDVLLRQLVADIKKEDAKRAEPLKELLKQRAKLLKRK